MGFMDKVKATAQDVAGQAQKVTSQAQSKLEQTQLRRKADDVARNLGYALVRQRTQGVDAAADIDAMVAEVTVIEAQIAEQEAAAKAAAQAAPPPPPQQQPPPGPMPGQVPPAQPPPPHPEDPSP